MNTYLVLKVIGKGTKKGRSAIVTPIGGEGKKGTCRVVGNIPELYHGMFIGLELDSKNYVLDYSLTLTEKNIQAIEKAGVNVEEYKEVLERHTAMKGDGVGWNTARMSLSEIYSALPFGEADKIHKEMVNNATEATRVEALNKEVLNMARNKRKISYAIDEYLGYFNAVEQQGAYEHIMTLLKMSCLEASKYSFSGGCVWDSEMKAKEEYIIDTINARKSLERSLLTVSEVQKFIKTIQDRGLAQEQIDTLRCLINTKPCVITGGAGVGKTTVIQTLIDCYCMHYSRKNVLLVAPTGKASRRLAEKTGMPASTIHKALRKNPEEDFVFYTEKNPLPHRLIIVDESSMIDTTLMCDLLSALDPTSKIVFVGDHNQLYPVGYGEPFFDFLTKFGLEVYKLEQNHRQAEGTDILDNAERALKGLQLYSGRGINICNIDYSDIGDIVKTMNDDTQIISPYNALNANVNDFLKVGEDCFNIGDKVMTVKNTKDYCNGDIGYVKRIDGKGTITVDIEGKLVEISAANYRHLTLAYAITVHKMQGSEAKRIILLLPKNDKIEKRMLYTAITRARDELEIYYFDVPENCEE